MAREVLLFKCNIVISRRKLLKYTKANLETLKKIGADYSKTEQSHFGEYLSLGCTCSIVQKISAPIFPDNGRAIFIIRQKLF